MSAPVMSDIGASGCVVEENFTKTHQYTRTQICLTKTDGSRIAVPDANVYAASPLVISFTTGAVMSQPIFNVILGKC